MSRIEKIATGLGIVAAVASLAALAYDHWASLMWMLGIGDNLGPALAQSTPESSTTPQDVPSSAPTLPSVQAPIAFLPNRLGVGLSDPPSSTPTPPNPAGPQPVAATYPAGLQDGWIVQGTGETAIYLLRNGAKWQFPDSKTLTNYRDVLGPDPKPGNQRIGTVPASTVDQIPFAGVLPSTAFFTPAQVAGLNTAYSTLGQAWANLNYALGKDATALRQTAKAPQRVAQYAPNVNALIQTAQAAIGNTAYTPAQWNQLAQAALSSSQSILAVGAADEKGADNVTAGQVVSLCGEAIATAVSVVASVVGGAGVAPAVASGIALASTAAALAGHQ